MNMIGRDLHTRVIERTRRKGIYALWGVGGETHFANPFFKISIEAHSHFLWQMKNSYWVRVRYDKTNQSLSKPARRFLRKRLGDARIITKQARRTSPQRLYK